MRVAAIPPNEASRIRRLRELDVLDTGAEPVFDDLVRVAALVVGAPIALVSLIDEKRQWFKANVGLRHVAETPRELAFCSHTILGDELLEVRDAKSDERYADNPLVSGDPNIRFYAGAPIVLRDGLRMGSLCVIDTTPRELTDCQRAILKTLAHAASEALDQRVLARERNVLLEQQAVSERQRAEDHVRFANILEATRAGTWEWTVATGALRCNERWAEIIGRAFADRDALTIDAWRALTHPDDRDRMNAQLDLHVDGMADYFDCEMRLRHRNGGWVWVRARGRLLGTPDDGTPPRMYGTIVDISTRKEVEDRLRASEEFLDRTGRAAGVGGWELRFGSSEIRWSDETCRIHDVPLGYRPALDEAIRFYAPEARPIVEAAVRQSMLDGKAWDLELPLVTAKGRSIWVRLYGTIQFDDGVPTWAVGAIQDITLRRRAVLALELSERRFRNLFEYSLGLICTHDLSGTVMSVNPSAARALGYSRTELMGRPLTDFMRPEAGPAFAAYLERIASNRVDSGLLRLVARDGTLHTWQYHNVLDEEGDEPQVLGHAQDITERERYERHLHDRTIRDPLTGCFNRRFLDDLESTLREPDLWGCVAIDLDHFKAVNDTFGHQRGDEVLVDMSLFLTHHVRPDDAVVRTGGDEFLIMLKGADEALTEQICRRIDEDRRLAPIAFSLGYAVRKAGARLQEALATADASLYATRAAGRVAPASSSASSERCDARR